ncbi:hypothetical protein PybrP1_008221 [[Pythium] brassicae (nom. inval.)]|nr:hypothetical protein PybrP1_008221 [[Pythium] brassicae (nom. inval.)]
MDQGAHVAPHNHDSTDNGAHNHEGTDSAESEHVGAKRPRQRVRGAQSKRRTGFQHKWLSKFALRVTSVDTVTSEVLVLACRLCEKFGRDKLQPPPAAASGSADEVGAPRPKRRPSTHVKHFKAPWRSDNIAHHARDQHARRFAEYELLTDKQREVYLEYTGPPHRDPAPFVAPLKAAGTNGGSAGGHPEPDAADLFPSVAPPPAAASAGSLAVLTAAPSRERVVSLVNAPIVDTILADLLLDLDSEYEALVFDPVQVHAIFGRHPRVGRKLEHDVYLVTAPSRLEFELCLAFAASGAALHQCAQLVSDAQARAPKTRIGAIATVDAVSFVRFAIAMNFQTLASVLAGAWAFALVLDGQRSHLGVRVRVHLGARDVQDFHVLALPVAERHSPQYLHDSIARLLTVLHANWPHKLVGVVSTGRACAPAPALAALLHAGASGGCYRVRSGAQQVERVVDALFQQLFDEAFVNALTAVTGHLRRQDALVAAMHGRACPRFVDTSWRAMGRLVDWFAAHRLEVKSYFDVKKPACAPPGRWWVLMAAVKRFKDIVDNALRKIRGLTTQLGAQRECLALLLAELVEVGYVRGPYEHLLEARDFDLEEGQKFVFGQYYATQRGAEALLEDLDPFVFEQLEQLKKKDGSVYLSLVASVAFIFGESASELAKIVASERVGPGGGASDDAKLLPSALPSVLPHELVLLSGSEMNRLLRTHQLRLCATYSKDEASAIHSEHAQLKTAYIREPSFKAQVDRAASSSYSSFAAAWGGLGALYPRLRNFAGALATVYPDAVDDAAEPQRFHVHGYERSEFRSSLVDFALEAVLHARQYPRLQEIASSLDL